MKRARLQKRIAVTTMFAVAACAAFLMQQQADRLGQPAVAAAAPAAPAPAPALQRVAAETAPAAARRVYPYSIVPGGVTDRIELARAVMSDEVVAAHYAGFALDKASLRTVAKARAVYVSYRKGDQVYWTARKVMLAEGENVLSDGRNEIRARCGNRISDTPQLPVEVNGVDERELDIPVEQVTDGSGGAVRTVAFGIDELLGGGQRFTLPPFPDGAGLLTAAQSQASVGKISLDSLLASDRAMAALPVLWGTAAVVSTRTTGSEPATGSGNDNDSGSGSGSSSGSTSDTVAGDPGGGSTSGTVAGDPGGGSTSGTVAGDPGGGGGGGGTGTGSGSGGEPTGGDTGQPPPSPPIPTPTPADPRTDPLPGGTSPAKDHELPEPGGLWLTGVAAAALLLQRRLRSRRPR